MSLECGIKWIIISKVAQHIHCNFHHIILYSFLRFVGLFLSSCNHSKCIQKWYGIGIGMQMKAKLLCVTALIFLLCLVCVVFGFTFFFWIVMKSKWHLSLRILNRYRNIVNLFFYIFVLFVDYSLLHICFEVEFSLAQPKPIENVWVKHFFSSVFTIYFHLIWLKKIK